VNEPDLVRLVDSLEDRAESYLTLNEVTAAAGEDVSEAIGSGLLLVDYRTRADGSSITLCRLNRHHPLVVKLTSW
jgi:hypothetical protein